MFHRLAEQNESRVEQGLLLPDHGHAMISIPPKYVLSQVFGFIEGRWKVCCSAGSSRPL